jgi:hypothetical protein
MFDLPRSVISELEVKVLSLPQSKMQATDLFSLHSKYFEHLIVNLPTQGVVLRWKVGLNSTSSIFSSHIDRYNFICIAHLTESICLYQRDG